MTDDASQDEVLLHAGRFLRLQRRGRWEYVRRTTQSGGAAALVAVTDAHEIVLVEQYRVPVQARTLELPAGIIGDEAGLENESVLASARRELLEETGFAARHLQMLFSGPTAPGMTSETSHLVLAHGLERRHAGGGVEGEDITVHVVPLVGADRWLATQAAAGRLIEPKVYAALYCLARWPELPALP